MILLKRAINKIGMGDWVKITDGQFVTVCLVILVKQDPRTLALVGVRDGHVYPQQIVPLNLSNLTLDEVDSLFNGRDLKQVEVLDKSQIGPELSKLFS